MADFKSMPKMCTDESSVILRTGSGSKGKDSGSTKMSTAKNTTGYQEFKKGGYVQKKADGGAMGALSDMATAKMVATRSTKKAPTKAMADKYPPRAGRPMPSKKPVTPPTAFAKKPEMGMKNGGEMHKDVAMDKKIVGKAVHKHESAMHPGKPLTKMKMGGVTSGAKNDSKAKYKDGGSIGASSKIHSTSVSSMPHGTAPAPTKATIAGTDAKWAKTKHNTHSLATRSSSSLKDYGATGEVPKTRAGGYKAGGKVAKFAFGGPSDMPTAEVAACEGGSMQKKKYADGGKVTKNATMNAEKMPQGKKAPSAPVRISMLAGTFKTGGLVRG